MKNRCSHRTLLPSWCIVEPETQIMSTMSFIVSPNHTKTLLIKSSGTQTLLHGLTNFVKLHSIPAFLITPISPLIVQPDSYRNPVSYKWPWQRHLQSMDTQAVNLHNRYQNTRLNSPPNIFEYTKS